MTLRISKDLELPLEAATWAIAVIGIRDSGKTYDADVIAEELIKAKIPILVIDGMGIHWGLRVAVKYVHGKQVPDPTKAGLPIVVFGGDHADLPIPTKTERTGKRQWNVVDEDRLTQMAQAILESGINAVLDTSAFSKKQQRRIVAVFAERVFQLNSKYGVRVVIVEEADMWAPQGDFREASSSLGAIDDLVRRGGNYNLGCILITQRPAVLNKNVLTQCGTIIVHRLVHDLDKKAVALWVRSVQNPDSPQIKKWFDSLRGLDNGEAYVWKSTKPEIANKRIRFRLRETLHASREFFRQPEVMKKAQMLNVDEFKEKFKKIFEPKVKEPPKTQPLAPPLLGVYGGLPSIMGDTPSRPQDPLYPYSDSQGIPRNRSGMSPPIGPITAPQTQPRGDVVAQITQATPIIQLTKIKPNVQLDLNPLQEPTSPLGRVCAVLAGSEQRDDRWSVAKIRSLVRAHAWEDDGVNEVVDDLVRWEILRKQSNGYIRFYRDRVQVSEATVTVGAQ